MASTTGPDLTDGRLAVEALMDDSCIIYDTTDEGEVFDRVSGTVVVDLGEILYDASSVDADGNSLADAEGTGGKCKTKPSIQDLTPSQAGVPTGDLEVYRFYTVGIPVGAPPIPNGATVVMQTARRDPRLVGLVMTVREAIVGTFALQQRMLVEVRESTTQVRQDQLP